MFSKFPWQNILSQSLHQWTALCFWSSKQLKEDEWMYSVYVITNDILKVTRFSVLTGFAVSCKFLKNIPLYWNFLPFIISKAIFPWSKLEDFASCLWWDKMYVHILIVQRNSSFLWQLKIDSNFKHQAVHHYKRCSRWLWWDFCMK